jgi:hypothetical protein
MSRFVVNFVRRWWWLLLIQLGISSACWLFFSPSQAQPDRGIFPLQHLEYAAAAALSWDLVRGQCRACLSMPITGNALSFGLWVIVVLLGPLVSCLALMPNAGYCWFVGMPLPSWSEITFHAAMAFLLGGTLQFVLSGLPAQTSPTLPGKMRDGIFAILWGLSISSPSWLGRIFPVRWESLQPAAKAAMAVMALLTLISCFTTARIVRERAFPPAPGASDKKQHKNDSFFAGVSEWERGQKRESPSLQSPGGWKVWLGLELRWMLFLPLMALVILGSLQVMGSFSSGGARTAIESSPTHFSSLGALCAMMVVPMFSLSCGSVRAFAALPVRRDLYALLMALRPPVYCLAMFSAFVLLSLMMGRPVGSLANAVCAFTLIGAVVSLLQPFLIRWPSFPAALGLGMVLMPTTMLLLPFCLKDNSPLIWMPELSVAFILISAALHRRFLRTSSKIYRGIPWLQRQALAGASR